MNIFKKGGASNGGAWPENLRLLMMEYLVHRVAPSSIPELIAKCTIAVVPFAVEAGLQMPEYNFVKNLRYELGVLARSEAAVALGESDSVATGWHLESLGLLAWAVWDVRVRRWDTTEPARI